LADISSVSATISRNETLLVVVQWRWSSGSVSVSLSVSNVVGEEIELRVEDWLVIDIWIEENRVSRDINTT
jgi:hypothetical protein